VAGVCSLTNLELQALLVAVRKVNESGWANAPVATM
jgi:hypothetical protein